MPWSGRLVPMHKLKDWLSLLDYEVKKAKSFYFLPPISNEKFLNKLVPLEKLGRYCWPFMGGLYVVAAQKRTVPLNPIKMQWKTKRKMLTSGAIEPTTRNPLKVNVIKK